MKEILCVDIGGSKYMVGVITQRGKFFIPERFFGKARRGIPEGFWEISFKRWMRFWKSIPYAERIQWE